MHEKQWSRAIRLQAAAVAMRDKIGAQLPPTDREKLTAILHSAEENLEKEVLAQLREEGSALDVDRAVQYALTNLL